MKKLKPKEEQWLRAICGYAAGMVFGLNGAFWPQAVIIAVWPLSILLLCLVLCLLQRWNFQPESRRCLYAAALVYGLLLTNSQIEFAFAPAIPFLVMIGNQKTGRDMFLVARFLFLAALGGIWTGHFPSLRGQGGQFFIFIVLGVVTSLMGIGLVVWTRRAFSEWKTSSNLRWSVFAGAGVLFLPADCLDDRSANKLGLSPHGGRFLPRSHSRAIRANECDRRRWTLSRTGSPVFCKGGKRIWLALSVTVPDSILLSAPNGCVGTSVDIRIAAGLRLPGFSDVGGVESKRGPAVSRARQGIFLRIVYHAGILDGLRTDNFGELGWQDQESSRRHLTSPSDHASRRAG